MNTKDRMGSALGSPMSLPRDNLRAFLPGMVLVFLLSYVLLFLGMSREPDFYDEGLVLTAAMRVCAGQIPHRDFYANYGPAQFYVLAGLFRAFGESLLVERLYDIFIKSLLISGVYALALSCCRRAMAATAAGAALLWVFSTNGLAGTPVIPVSLLNLIGLALLLPVFSGRLSTARLLGAGAVAGMATLFRYDTGLALLCVEICALAIGVYCAVERERLRSFARAIFVCLAAFGLVTLPALCFYLSVSPLRPVVFDIVLYPAKYYHRGRNLPLPGITLKNFENIEVYLLVPLIGISLYLALASLFLERAESTIDLRATAQKRRVRGFLLVFGLLSLIMYFKGLVRMQVEQMYLCIIPSLLLTAVLLEYRSTFARSIRLCVVGIAGLSGLVIAWVSLHEIRRLQVYHLSVPERMVKLATGTIPAVQQVWCETHNPLTRGFCFLVDRDRREAIEFLDSHTIPGQQTYVGLTNHDRVFANDNMIYFGAQRLPATMWSHFDPGLQNSAEIQLQMIAELKASAPPYVVIDGEFAAVREPNESSVSTGVTLLDDYIHQAYRPVANFDRMSVWQRTN